MLPNQLARNEEHRGRGHNEDWKKLAEIAG